MDSGDYIYLAFFALWLLGRINEFKKKSEQRAANKRQTAAPQTAQPQTQPTGPHAAPASQPGGVPAVQPSRPQAQQQAQPQAQAQKHLESLDRLEAEIGATLAEIDERVGAQASYLVDHGFRGNAEQLRSELRDETSPEFRRAVQETTRLVSHYRGVLQTARVHSGLRQRQELRGAHAVADRLVAEFDLPRNAAVPIPPPVAIVWDVAPNDPLRESALAHATLFVPRTVLQDPSHWSLIAPEMAGYLGTSAPELYQDIYEGLELGVAEAQIGNDPEALTRVLFASWIGRIVADAVGALYFGPAYLLSVARLYAQPQAPAQVTSIVLNQDGTVAAEPPVHVRVHQLARWLTLMGHRNEATAIVSSWDEQHGSPAALGFWGSTTSLPAASVLAATDDLTDALFQLPLSALGNARLAHVPGLSGWEHLTREADDAKASLLAGNSVAALGSARALVAGAIEASLEHPETNAAINDALQLSGMVVSKRAVVSHTANIPAPSSATNPFAGLTGRDVGEALILGEIIL